MKSRALIFFVSVAISGASALASVAAISGKIISSATDEPVVRAEIWWNGAFHSYSDVSGRFEILGTAVGDVIRVHKKDFVDTSAIAEFENAEINFDLAPVWALTNAHQIYEDVAEYAWYEPAVRELYERQVFSATEVQKFLPSENLTRGELAVLGVKVAGFLPAEISETHFCDVAPDDDFAPAVEFMFRNNWLSGYSSSECEKGRVFRAGLPVNRAEAVKMVLTVFRDLAEKKVTEKVCLSAGFSDVPADAWFTDFVNEANCLGFVNGNPDGTFRPANPVNRAEIAVIFKNALESLF